METKKIISSQLLSVSTNEQQQQQQRALEYLENEEDDYENSALCCCEYISKEQQQPYRRNHMLACCCNCRDFDAVFTQLVTCRTIDTVNWRNMLNTFRDRFRIPWRGGAKEISFEAILPGLLLPLMFLTSALNEYAAIVITILAGVSLLYVHHRVQQRSTRTRFFCMWIVWSLIYMIVLFESTVPLLEVLPEENLLLVMLCALALYCLYRTRQRAVLNLVQQQQETVDVEEKAPLTANDDIERQSDETICSTCRKHVPPRTVHCSACGACIMRHDHHSYWLDCCIGQGNQSCYMLGLLVSAVALLLGANLTCTAVCHPLLVVRGFGLAFMVPDDCSRVFDEYEFALPFMLAVYGFLMAVYIALTLLQQIVLISFGITLHEHRCGRQRNGALWKNWKNLLFN